MVCGCLLVVCGRLCSLPVMQLNFPSALFFSFILNLYNHQIVNDTFIIYSIMV